MDVIHKSLNIEYLQHWKNDNNRSSFETWSIFERSKRIKIKDSRKIPSDQDE